MRNLWSDSDAQQAIDRYAKEHGEAVALRVYTSRLIGADSALVLHGGGNTSVKAPYVTLLGEEVEAIYVKGSGWNLDSLEPAGLPALDLSYLRRLRSLSALSDEEMVNQLRTHLFKSSAPNPSVETLLHAFLPQRFVDHSHADAILAITNQPDGDEIAAQVLGKDAIVLPYIMPGFPLALAVADAIEKQPSAKGVVLAKHGLFTFAEDARTSYEAHIEWVDRCEQHVASKIKGKAILTPSVHFEGEASGRVAQVAPLLRGLLAERDEEQVTARYVMDWRSSEEIIAFCNSQEAERLVKCGPLTPDHVIRTKARPLYIANPNWNDEVALRSQIERALADYRHDYDNYFERCCREKKIQRTKLDASPRVVLLAGAGALCFGKSKQDALIAADITEHTLLTKAQGEALGRYEALSDSDLFDMEYWSLEQAKLGKAKTKALAGQVVLITGGAGAIGMGVARACAAAGAHLVIADLEKERAQQAATQIQEQFGESVALGVAMDVCDEVSVRQAFESGVLAYGGIDLVVPNAGLAHVAPIAELAVEDARKLTEVNYIGVLLTMREAQRTFEKQGTGGNIVVISSKNVFAPGKDFGAYSASKAAAHQLAKIAAMELAPLGVRVNMINADAVFGDSARPSGLWQEVGPARAESRGLALQELPEFYRKRNLLKAKVKADHVGNAVVFFASEKTPTTGATLPVDGGVVEAFPR